MAKMNCMRTGAATSLVLLVSFFASSAKAGYSADDDDGSSDGYFRGHDSGGGGGGSGGKHLPAILMHKQALQEDGGFQYAFAADNGLRQGESIRPDGSRTGAYSYTDPDGKEISVKYTAGKDGFRIIQGDHVPKAPVSVVPVQQPALGGGASYNAPALPGRSASSKNRLFGAPGGPGSQFSRGDLSNVGRYDHGGSGEAFSGASPALRPKSFPKTPQQHYRVREENSAELAARFDDDGGSAAAYDGAGDYSSHSPFRAPPSQARAAIRVDVPQKEDDGSYDSDERQQQPHTFGSGYAFEFGGTNAGAGTSAEF